VVAEQEAVERSRAGFTTKIVLVGDFAGTSSVACHHSGSSTRLDRLHRSEGRYPGSAAPAEVGHGPSPGIRWVTRLSPTRPSVDSAVGVG
jgi:hypothetical protein